MGHNRVWAVGSSNLPDLLSNAHLPEYKLVLSVSPLWRELLYLVPSMGKVTLVAQSAVAFQPVPADSRSELWMMGIKIGVHNPHVFEYEKLKKNGSPFAFSRRNQVFTFFYDKYLST